MGIAIWFYGDIWMSLITDVWTCDFWMLDVDERYLDVAENGWSPMSYSACCSVESARRPDMAGFLASQMNSQAAVIWMY